MRTVWILEDQLHDDHAGLKKLDRHKDRVLFIESRKWSGRVSHHQVKLALIFSAMRHRAEVLRDEGWQVDYIPLTDSFAAGLAEHTEKTRPDSIIVQEPTQYQLAKSLNVLSRKINVIIEVIPENQFLLSRAEFSDWAADSRQLLMENHYRRMRKKLNLLIDEAGKPEGGNWNFDADNRETYADMAKSKVPIPDRPEYRTDSITRSVIGMVKQEFPNNPGNADRLWLPVTRSKAKKHLQVFIETKLKHFGPWEDVMVEKEPVLFHSVLTPALNLGLLTPKECVEAAVQAFEAGQAPVASVEGFIRQIIGWREFINGIYWHRMPGYEDLNHLQAERPLPKWFYTAETEMNCLRQVLLQVMELGYNHHIQRLMVLGNFALLGGFLPREVLKWFLEMYVDGYEWVMAGNVIGMILHADGGYMATKPYAAGSGYINRMSNYCEGCRYRPDKRVGPDACPFNYLYWNFFATHEARFEKNPRIGMMVKTWRKKTESEQREIQRQADQFLGNV